MTNVNHVLWKAQFLNFFLLLTCLTLVVLSYRSSIPAVILHAQILYQSSEGKEAVSPTPVPFENEGIKYSNPKNPLEFTVYCSSKSLFGVDCVLKHTKNGYQDTIPK